MKVTDEMTVTQILALIEKLLEDVDAIRSDCENICASMEMLRETDHSKTLEAAETWGHTAVGTISDADRALKTVSSFLTPPSLRIAR
jgi:hypothetical protein